MISPVHRARILVVEDEAAIAVMLEYGLTQLGYVVIGPTSRLSTAIELARDSELDAALLDVTIRGGRVYPVADILRQRGIPFLLASGYGKWALPEALREAPRLTKPFSMPELEEQLKQLLQIKS